MVTSYKNIGWQLSFLCFCVMIILITCTVARAESKIALLIGNEAYKATEKRLIAPVNDVENMKNALQSIDFSVTPIKNAYLEEMQTGIRAFMKKLSESDEKVIAIFYYSGHSIKYKEEHYLLPIGSIDHINSHHFGFFDIPAKTIPLEGWVIKILQEVEDRKRYKDTIFFIFDGYRKSADIFKHSRSEVRGFNPLGMDVDAKIICSGGSFGPTIQKYNPFTKYFAQFLREPNLTVKDIFRKAAIEVHKATDNRQLPWQSGEYWDRILNPILEAKLKIKANVSRAKIFIDGDRHGFTSDKAKIIKLSQGWHNVRVEKYGYTTVEKRVKLGKREKFLPVELQRKVVMAMLSVSTNVQGEEARLFIDKKKKGLTPIDVELQFGRTYDIRIEKNDYFPYIEKSFRVKKKEDKLYAKLDRKAILRVFSIVQGAEVIVNGKSYATPIDREIELPFGQHITVQLKRNGQIVVKEEVNLNQQKQDVHLKYPEPKGAIMKVTSNEIGAQIIFDFERTNYTTPKSFSLPPDCYTIWVIKEGYTLESGSKKVCLNKGEQKNLFFTLKRE